MVSGLYTTVKNISGTAKVFGFLGAHGKRLADDGTYTVPGDLVATLGNGGKGGQRKFKALEKALEAGDLTIVSSPSVYLSEGNSYYEVNVAEGSVALGFPSGWYD
jgi:hypothetical protein